MNNILTQGAVISVIGLGTVFVVLAILWGVLELMRVIFTVKKPTKTPAEAPAPVKAAAPAEPAAAPAEAAAPAAPQAPAAAPSQDDDELIAVLTAAVAACLNQSANGLHIRSYRRIDAGTPVWNRTARRDNVIG